MSNTSDTLDLIDAFANFYDVMKQRAFDKQGQGYTGWNDEESYDLMWSKLHTHVLRAEEGNVQSYVDIANLAMFLHGLKVYK